MGACHSNSSPAFVGVASPSTCGVKASRSTATGFQSGRCFKCCCCCCSDSTCSLQRNNTNPQQRSSFMRAASNTKIIRCNTSPSEPQEQPNTRQSFSNRFHYNQYNAAVAQTTELHLTNISQQSNTIELSTAHKQPHSHAVESNPLQISIEPFSSTPQFHTSLHLQWEKATQPPHKTCTLQEFDTHFFQHFNILSQRLSAYTLYRALQQQSLTHCLSFQELASAIQQWNEATIEERSDLLFDIVDVAHKDYLTVADLQSLQSSVTFRSGEVKRLQQKCLKSSTFLKLFSNQDPQASLSESNQQSINSLHSPSLTFHSIQRRLQALSAEVSLSIVSAVSESLNANTLNPQALASESCEWIMLTFHQQSSKQLDRTRIARSLWKHKVADYKSINEFLDLFDRTSHL